MFTECQAQWLEYWIQFRRSKILILTKRTDILTEVAVVFLSHFRQITRLLFASCFASTKGI
jgi:hypothetical protein